MPISETTTVTGMRSAYSVEASHRPLSMKVDSRYWHRSCTISSRRRLFAGENNGWMIFRKSRWRGGSIVVGGSVGKLNGGFLGTVTEHEEKVEGSWVTATASS